MKKILFITPYIPYPLNSGGNQAFFNMVNYIRTQMSVSILLYPRHSADIHNTNILKSIWTDVNFYIYQPKSEKDSLPVRHPLYLKWLLKAHASLTRKIRRQYQPYYKQPLEQYDMVRTKSTIPISIFGGMTADYVDYVAHISRLGFDIIQVEFYELISLCYILPQDVQTVFVHHELRFVHNANEMQLFKETTNIDRMLFGVSKDYERGALSHYKHIITLTEIDRQILINLMGRKERIYVSPAVVKMPQSPTNSFQPAIGHRLTFVGSEDHCPNLDAVIWFCREIIPLLREKGFKFSFQIIGNWKSEYIKKLCKNYPEMELVGFIKDLHSFQRGSIALVPIRIGAGMRMKIMDAISAEVPFVTTSKGVEGLDFRNGEECLIADTASTFADAIIKLSDNVKLQEQMVQKAEKRLKQLYDYQQMLYTRKAIYDRILES